MGASYSQDLRDRVLRCYDRGMSTKQIADVLCVSPAWARRVKQQRRQTGRTCAQPLGGARRIKIDPNRLAELVKAHPDATLKELRQRLGIVCGESAICMALQRLKLSFKKTIHAAEQDRADVAARRSQWRSEQLRRDAGKLIFIDETWAKTNMTRLRGRAPIGQRLIAKIPHGHWKTTTLIAALDRSGIRCSTVVDGAVNADVFEAFIEQVLLPTLSAGDIVVMDNLSSHKRSRTRELIRSQNAEVLYLPPYSPDLNPIENVFAKIKQSLRGMACRTQEALWKTLQSVLDHVSPSDATNCFRHCGYTLHLE